MLITHSASISEDGEILREYELTSVTAAFYSKHFYQYLLMLTLGNIFGGIFCYQYKPYGLAHNLSDKMLTYAGGLSSITQFITRISVGYLYDKIGFKPINIALMIIALFAACFSVYSVRSAPFYFIIIQLNYMVIGGIFALFPTPAANTFGKEKGPQVYSLIIMGSLIAAFTDTMLVVFAFETLGVHKLYMIGGVCALISLIMSCFFDE